MGSSRESVRSLDEGAARRCAARAEAALERRVAVAHARAEVGGTHARASGAVGTTTAAVQAALPRGENGPSAAREAVGTVRHTRPRPGARRRAAGIDTPGVVGIAPAPRRSERREAAPETGALRLVRLPAGRPACQPVATRGLEASHLLNATTRPALPRARQPYAAERDTSCHEKTKNRFELHESLLWFSCPQRSHPSASLLRRWLSNRRATEPLRRSGGRNCAVPCAMRRAFARSHGVREAGCDRMPRPEATEMFGA